MALLGHGNEVQCSIETTRKLRQIDIESKLVSNELEHLVVIRILHEV